MIAMHRQHFLALATCFAALSFGTPLFAAERTIAAFSDTPNDYAYAVPIQHKENQGVVVLHVPRSVYLKARTAGLDDLRVFDAKGAMQPFSLQRAQTETQTQRSVQAAAIFPIRTATKVTASLDLDIATRADGSVISVHTARTGNVSAPDTSPETLSGLILDFGATPADSRTTALRFTRPADRQNYTAEVWLETSDDLKHWEAAGAAELGWLTNDEAQTLASDRLEIGAQRFRYARLTWQRGEAVVFPKIEAERIVTTAQEVAHETLWITPQAGQLANDLAYSAAIALPIDHVEFRLGEANIVFPLALGSYVERYARRSAKNPETLFLPQLRTTLFQITQDGRVRRSGPITLPTTHRSEWIVRPLNSVKAHPELGISWQPDTLVFLAGGTPPYRLAVGRNPARPAEQPLAQVAPGFDAEEIKRLELATTGEPQPINPIPAQTARPNDKPPVIATAAEASRFAKERTFALWGALFLGVVILGAMTWKLIRDMQGKAAVDEKSNP